MPQQNQPKPLNIPVTNIESKTTVKTIMLFLRASQFLHRNIGMQIQVVQNTWPMIGLCSQFFQAFIQAQEPSKELAKTTLPYLF